MIAWIKSWFKSDDREVQTCIHCGEPQIKWAYTDNAGFQSYCRNGHSW